MNPVVIFVFMFLAIVLVGLVFLALPKKEVATAPAQPAQTTTPSPASPASNASPKDERAQDEPKGKWEWLGLVDDTPNMIRCVVTGWTGKGRVLKCIRPNDKRQPGLFGWRSVVEKLTGKMVFGTPLFTSLRTVEIDRVVLGQTRTDNADLNLIDEINATGVVKRRGLKEVFQRPIYHSRLDTGDKVKINLNTNSVVRVIDPEKGFVYYNDSLLQSISQTIKDNVSVQVWKMKFDDIGKVPFDLTELNKSLFIFGVMVDQMTTSDPEIAKGSEEVQKAMEKVIIAKKEAEAAMETAEGTRNTAKGERDRRIFVAEGDAKAIERLAKAEAKRFDELHAALMRGGLTNTEAIRRAQETVIAEFNAEAIGKLTYYATGNQGPQLTVPVVAKEKGDEK